MPVLKLTPEGTLADLKKHIETLPINPHKVVSIKTMGSKLRIVEKFKNAYGQTVYYEGIYNKRLKMANFGQEELAWKILKTIPYRQRKL
jgi:hypothetical protein